jgi:hypothetical protein
MNELEKDEDGNYILNNTKDYKLYMDIFLAKNKNTMDMIAEDVVKSILIGTEEKNMGRR